MKAPRLILSAFVAFGLASCGTPQGGGAPGPRPASAQQAERQQSQQILAELQQKNMLVKGDRVNDYVDEITARINAVRPNNASRLRTYIIKDASANAFTSGAGYVFIHAGLLATMENEAQLAMVLAHEIGDYLFVHAGIRPGIPVAEQDPHDLLWIREPFLSTTEDLGRIVVHGHTISPEVEERPNRIGVDTGAYHTGRLTCLVLAGDSRTYLQT